MNPYIDKTYGEALDHVAAAYGERDALVFRDRRYTFRDIKREVDLAAARLASLDLGRGDCVAVWLPNRPEFLWYWLALAKSGQIAVVLNTRLQREEFVYQLRQSNCRAVIVPGAGSFRDFLADLAAICPTLAAGHSAGCKELEDLRAIVCCDPPGPDYPGVLDWSSPIPGLPVPPMETDPTRPAMLAYSSGTTSLPKGALLNHCAWRKTYDGGERLGITPEDRLYLCVPLFGVLATFNGILAFWGRGACVVLEERFDPGQCLAMVEKERCTAIHLLPAMVDALIDHPDFRRRDLSRLRTGIALTQEPELIETIAARLGVPGIVTSYGMTESTGVVTRTWWYEPLAVRTASQGRPLPDVEIRIVDPETTAELPRGQLGEIWIRGYCVMPGYYNMPEATRAAITPDGWLRSGDIGEMLGDGSIRFHSRLKDVYKHKGFNISAAEVEKAISQHPKVAAVQVVGVPHRQYGEIGAAFIIGRNGLEPTEVINFLRPRLASFKLPAHVFLVDAFPVTAGTEKVQKFRLREMALQRINEMTTGGGS